MPALTNHKHELFSQGIAEGKKPPVAYQDAGYETKDSAADAAASRLLKNVKILDRIKELKNKIAEKFIRETVVTRERVVRQLIQYAEDAAEEGQYSVASGNWIKLGIDIGMFENKSTVNLNVKTHEEQLRELE
jgi:phage terminase small subunit